MRRVLFGLKIFAIALCLIIIAALIAVNSSPVRRYAVDQVVALLAREQIEFSTDELSYNVLNASVNLRNIRVRSTTWPDAPVFATVGQLRINLSLLQLLRGRYVVQSGTVDNLDVHYVVDEQGHDNLPLPPKDPNAPSKPLDYLVSSLTVAKANVRYENRAEHIDVQLPLGSLEVSGNDLTKRHEITLDAGGGSLQIQDRHTTIDRVTGQVDLGKDDLSIARFELDSSGLHAEISGSIKKFDAPVTDLSVTSDVNLMAVAPFANVQEPVSGSLTIDATAKGPLATPVVNAHVSGSSLQVRDLHDAQLDATAVYDMATRQADVQSLKVSGPWGELTGGGNVALDGAGSSTAHADITDFDAGSVMQSLHLPYVVATRVDGKVQAQWPGLDYLRATGAADAKLRPTTAAPSRSVMPVGGHIVANGNGGRIQIQIQQLSLPGGQANGTVAVTSDRHLQGQVNVRSMNVAQLTSAIEAFDGQPRGSLVPTPVSGLVDVTARLGGTLDAPAAATTINAPSLKVGELDQIAVSADASYAPGAITIARADVTWQEAKAHIDGRVGLGANQPLAISVSADGLDVMSLLEAMNQAGVPVSGQFTARGMVEGTASRPMATFTVQGSGLVAYDEQLGSLNAVVRLDGRQLTLSELVVEKPQPDRPGRIMATGTYDLTGKTYTIDLQSQDVRLLGLVLPDGRQVRGIIEKLAAHGAGSLASPEGTVDLNVNDLEVGDVQGGRIVVTAVAKNREATINAAAERFKLDADALIGLAQPWPATVKVRTNNLDLATLLPPATSESAPATMPGLEGQLRATIDASGNLTEPAKGRATVALESLEGKWNGRPFSVTSPSPLQYADQRLTVERLNVTASDATLTVSGNLPLTDDAAPGEIAVDLHGNLATVTQYLPPDTNIAGDGSIALTGSLRGTLKRIDPDLMLTLDKGLILSPALEPGFSGIVLRARLANGEADIDQLTANWGTASIQGMGRIPLEVLPKLPVEIPRMSGPATLKIGFTGLDPAAIPGAPAQLSGRISADAEVTAASADLAALAGQITFRDLDVAFGGLGLKQEQPSTITIASGTATVTQLALTGSAGELHAGGSVGLTDDRALNVDVDGKLNVAAVSLVTDQVRAEGDSTLKLAARGTVASPEVTGTVDLMDTRAASNEPEIAAENINAHVELEGKRIVLSKLTADVNGGTLAGSGDVTLGEGGISDINLDITTNDVAYDAPLDLRSISDAKLKVTKSDDDILVSGQVTIDEAGLTSDINFDTGLLASMTARPKLELTERRNPLLERLRFNIKVNTASPILVDNNLARAEISSDLTVVGTAYETGLLGELTINEGSEIRLNERRYETQRGVLSFADERRIFPSFDLLLNTTAGSYDITIAVTGTPGNTETVLTSDPSLPEPDIMAMLITGRTLDDMRGQEYEVARQQVLSYLAGRVGSSLGRGLQKATGLSEVRIEPTLIASEADPSARLTIGQELTDQLKLVYSTNLTDSNDQIWVAEYDVTRRFQTRGVRQEDNSYRFDFRHDVRFGGQPEPRRTARTQPTVAAVDVTTATGMDEAAVRKAFRVKAKDHYDFFAIRNGVERVEKQLAEQGYLQSRVRLERGVEGDQAHLTVRVTPGPKVDLQFMGATPPAKVVEQVRTQWHRGVFDKQRGDDSVDALREWLFGDNYLQSKIDYRIEDPAQGQRRVVFQIQPGGRSQKIVLAFAGASGIDPDQLDKIVAQQKLERKLFTDPLVVTELLKRYYREEGFLAADIEQPKYEFQDTTARVVFAVQEGPKFNTRKVSVSGNTIYATDLIVSQLPVVMGEPFRPIAAENALEKIRDLYWAKGYNDVRSDYAIVQDSGGGTVDIAFTIQEGRQSVIAGITIGGTDRVSEHLVENQIQLEQSQPLDLSALAKSRRNLYDTGAFSVVDITRKDIEIAAPAAETAPASPESSDGSPLPAQKPVEIDVRVREVQPIQIRYGASYDTERGVGGILDVSSHNLIGKAREVGVRSRYDRQIHEGRLYINQPALTYFPKTTGAIYLRQELNPPTELTDPFDISRKGASIQQEMKLQDAYVLTYGYRYERVHTLTPFTAGEIIDERLTVTPVTGTLTRETRDEVLDASRGTFISHAFSYSPGWLGSTQPFIKYLGQYFHYFPLRPPLRKPFTNEMIRPRLVYATGIRIGLAEGFGGPVPRSERFFAGGSATLRGFAQNAVGSIGPDRIPIGGEAMLLLNNELRAPLFSIFDGVAFLDLGNVFNTVKDFSVIDLRKSVGLGLRVRTPWVLLRGDYGFVLDPRPGESRGHFYFSIGQAF